MSCGSKNEFYKLPSQTFQTNLVRDFTSLANQTIYVISSLIWEMFLLLLLTFHSRLFSCLLWSVYKLKSGSDVDPLTDQSVVESNMWLLMWWIRSEGNLSYHSVIYLIGHSSPILFFQCDVMDVSCRYWAKRPNLKIAGWAQCSVWPILFFAPHFPTFRVADIS